MLKITDLYSPIKKLKKKNPKKMEERKYKSNDNKMFLNDRENQQN